MENSIEDQNKKLPFEVPEGYFEGFEEKMMARFAEMEKQQSVAPVEKPNVNVRNIKWRRLVSGVAAAVLVIVGVMTVMNLMNDVSETGDDIVAATTQSMDDEYYDALNEELNSEEIEEALAQINYEDGIFE